MDTNKIIGLNIGCGKQHFKEFINMDISDYCGPDIQHDIREGFPMYKDSEFEKVIANGVLEMVLPNDEFLFVFNELWRIIKPGGYLYGQVPSTDPRVLGLDPFDRRWFMEATFDYFNIDHNAWHTFGTQYGFKPWEIEYAKANDSGIINFKMSPAK